VIFATLTERKIKGACQRRIGPNTTGWLGLLQPLTDGIKLIIKENIIPGHSNHLLFILSPFLFFGIALFNWLILPLDNGIFISELLGGGILITITLSELSILGTLYAGYSSNSKYSLLGSLRAIGKKISYSIAISLSIISVLLLIGSVDFHDIIKGQNYIGLSWSLLPI